MFFVLIIIQMYIIFCSVAEWSLKLKVKNDVRYMEQRWARDNLCSDGDGELLRL